MKKTNWIDAGTACALLGVKPQTLYAYVSRKQVRAKADAMDGRRSLYAQNDIDALTQQNRRSRARSDVAQAAIRWGDPVLSTSISEVRNGMLWLRGQAVDVCADTMALEDVAAVLCDVPVFSTQHDAGQPEQGGLFARAMKGLAREAADAPPMPDQSRVEIAASAGRILGILTNTCLGQCADGPVHHRFAAAWRLQPDGADMVRRALVLLSDHELNPSTFAVRVCASTGTSLPASLLAGMATLSGPRHGSAATLAGAALRAAMAGHAQEFIGSHSDLDPYAYGFGHRLYPDGDPRAAHLLRHLPQDAPEISALRKMSGIVGRAPNIDAALSALASHVALPVEAAQTIFAIGRLAGWSAHAMEQAGREDIIRPRARYVPDRS